jgi:hypothetical protein
MYLQNKPLLALESNPSMINFLDEVYWKAIPDEQLVYDHLLYWVQIEMPEQVIDRFRSIFFNSFHYSNGEVLAALDRVTLLPQAQNCFKLFFNRCCYILINRWQSQPLFQDAVPEFFALLESPISPPVAGLGRSPAVKRLRALVQGYQKSEHFQRLRRTTQFLLEDERDISAIGRNGSKPLLGLIRRYPYLYSHCLISDVSSPEQKQAIRQAEMVAQKRFEQDLSQYLTYDFRRQRPSGRVIQPIRNPTLLSDDELRGAMKQFVGKVDGSSTYRDLAHRFTVQASQVQNCNAFKDDFFDYLTTAVDTRFGGGRFHNQLRQQIETITAAHSGQKFNDFTLVRTCNQLLSFLIVDNPQHPQHYVFMDLLNNVGTTSTVGLLLKIVLVCNKIKPYLEKRFAILFSHYETHSRSSMKWLVGCLEQLNVAWSAHFGSRDFSFVNQML